MGKGLYTNEDIWLLCTLGCTVPMACGARIERATGLGASCGETGTMGKRALEIERIVNYTGGGVRANLKWSRDDKVGALHVLSRRVSG